LKYIIIGFEVHQPYRLKGSLHWRTHTFDKVDEENLFSYYFDEELNNKLFMTVAERCYLPTNQQILELIDLYPELRFVYSLSGIFVEQCKRFNPSVLDSFKELGETGSVEFLCQTYYHSLSSLFPDLREFSHQVIEQQKLIYDLFGIKPSLFENTEFIYNNEIAKEVEDLGFKGIYTEGYSNKLQSYDIIYKPKSCKKLFVLLRNPDLSDILGFNFSSPKNINEPIHVNEVIKKILM
jgi:alpha-amylase